MTHRRRRSRVTALIDTAMTVFGLTMAVSPLLLWVTPTAISLYLVIGAVAVSAVMVMLLAGYDTPTMHSYPPGHMFTHDRIKVSLPPELIAEAQKLPFMSRSERERSRLRAYVQAKTRLDR